jgi:hypothetical protein
VTHTPDDEGGPAPRGPDLPGGAAGPEPQPQARTQSQAQPQPEPQRAEAASGSPSAAPDPARPGFAQVEAAAETDPLLAAALPDFGASPARATGAELELRRSAEVEPSGAKALPAESLPAEADPASDRKSVV